ncbi:hypothetical protein [Duganella guangzhouensis]|nr:hypothetical protein [Duganella guangzhouensis]
MTTIAAKLITPAAPTSSWKKIIRRAFETLGKHYSHGPYML